MPTNPQNPFIKFDAFILIAFLLFCAAGYRAGIIDGREDFEYDHGL